MTAEIQGVDIAKQAWNELTLVSIGRCVCGAGGGILVATHDRHGLPVNTLLCLRCGTVRSDVAVSDGSAAEFYGYHYPRMHPGLGDEEMRREREERQARYLELLYGPTWFHGQRIVELGGMAVSWLNCGEWYTDDVARNKTAIKGVGHDLILSIHVLEHQHDPVMWLRRIVSWYGAPGARVITVVPDLLEVHHHRYGVDGWWQLAHPWNWTAGNVAIPHALAGLDVIRITRAAPGTLATVGSLVVDCEVSGRIGSIRRYLEI